MKGLSKCFKEVKSEECHLQIDSANQFPPATQGATWPQPSAGLWELSQLHKAFFPNCQHHPVLFAFF